MAEPAPYEIKIAGARPAPLRDLYHAVLRWPWSVTLALISAVYLALNAAFAVGYLAVGGLAGGRESFADDFFFSVQTMGTIGYGVLHPESGAANLLVTLESLTSLIFTAVTTGMVFAKFSRSRARMVFSRRAAIAPIDGVPTLMFRVGNERGNFIVDAQIRILMSITETTKEGMLIYRNLDVHPVRERLLTLSRSWTILHQLSGDSPLAGHTPESLVAKEVEIFVSVIGLDDTSMQPVAAQHRYFPSDIVWGARHVDILSETPDGNLLLDLRKFHELQPTAPTPEFPYPR